ncbi:DUF1330 domain-containing protein [Neptunomonas phycophila]|uniref:DUF1330 domain-containing protein n=1 Tax=Neptunomonas phycophila TaxID=1572645 RepID=UPI0015BEBBDA|nr:DUF1330 domain-containing protein [Neptunomonas phycophila]MDO6467560.1 DUF1330 domain-containing protein [Neptunomonas phycophila]QLE98432.1 DUF1330 domain-containing protein [Neptunomonas phycophila]
MSAYIIVESNVIDAEKLAQYSQQAAKTVTASHGEFIAKGKATLLTGESQTANGAIIRFENKEAAQAWYLSESYQALIPLRDQAMNCTFKLVDGL